MSENTTIALDAMGGDHGPAAVVPAALIALRRCRQLRVILVGMQARLEQALADAPTRHRERIVLRHAAQVVGMDESPASALRKKKDSSMRVAIDLVASGEADACVSAGNTGALTATSRFVLKMLPGVDRPAIGTRLPSLHGHTYMLDLGANVDSSAEHLRGFAVMGSVLASAVEDIARPRVALLNIGEEDIKGNEQVKQAASLLERTDLNYVGYAEGDDIFLADYDVIVCDGFVGNVALKCSEGAAKLLTGALKAAFNRNVLTKLSALPALSVLKSFKNEFDPGRYNGASLLGLRGIVVKSHGNASAATFANAIHIAVREVEKQVPRAIRSQLEKILAGPDATTPRRATA